MAYDTTGATVGAAGHDAATIVGALIALGAVNASDVQTTYEGVTRQIVTFLLELQGEVALTTQVNATPATSAPRSGSYRRPTGGRDPNTLELRSGKYAGKTVGEIIDLDREYAEWFAESGKNEFMAKKFAEALSAA